MTLKRATLHNEAALFPSDICARASAAKPAPPLGDESSQLETTHSSSLLSPLPISPFAPLQSSFAQLPRVSVYVG